jgi:dihydrofolate synthase/folylpolyglutamate synthase
VLEADREIERLMALHPKGYDLSLDRIRRLLDRLGNPQDRLPPVIHIAGTNGKGSAAAFSRACWKPPGCTVHVHTSPHLVNWHERYRLGAPGGGKLCRGRRCWPTRSRASAKPIAASRSRFSKSSPR